MFGQGQTWCHWEFVVYGSGWRKCKPVHFVLDLFTEH